MLNSCSNTKPNMSGVYSFNLHPNYYRDVNYVSQYRFNKSLVVKVVDKRPEEEKNYDENKQWFYNEIWAAPPHMMLQRIFSEELQSTGMFETVFNAESPMLIYEIDLLSLLGNYGAGRMATGSISVHSTLKSVSEDQIIIDKSYKNVSSNTVPKFRNAYRYIYKHIGNALHNLTQEIIMDLETALIQEQNKKGTMAYPDGRIYKGQGENGMMNGQGSFNYPDGTKYEGQWKDGKAHGMGIMTWPDNAQYVGQWEDNKRNGQGAMTYPDGTIKIGEFRDGKFVEE